MNRRSKIAYLPLNARVPLRPGRGYEDPAGGIPASAATDPANELGELSMITWPLPVARTNAVGVVRAVSGSTAICLAEMSTSPGSGSPTPLNASRDAPGVPATAPGDGDRRFRRLDVEYR